MPSVLQDWVSSLPLRAQGTLLTCVRGCDLTPKLPLDSGARVLVGMLRHAFMVPADPREVGTIGAFFQPAHAANLTHWLMTTKVSEFGHLPQHWVSHVMHASEVLGYYHPFNSTHWLKIYGVFCHNMHVPMEGYEAFVGRMTEDRIASGTVVS